jgi:LysM repeat protein
MKTFQPVQRENDEHSQMLIQPSLEIGREDDEHEKEADHVADKVMKMSDPEEEKKKMPESKPLLQKMSSSEPVAKMPESRPLLQKMGTPEKEEEEEPLSIQKKTDGSGNGMLASKNVEQGINSSKGSGQSLSPDLQNELGGKMNANFSGVKVHTDEKAVQMNKEVGAKAFTHGNDIYFNKGQYNPTSNQGKHLLAHELTHTVQQQGADIKKKDSECFDYMVKPGDSWWKIANKYGTTVEVLKSLNKNKEKLYPGDVLKVPYQYSEGFEIDPNTMEVTPVKYIIVPEGDLTYEQLLTDNFEIKESMLENEALALDNFETVVNSSSSSEGIVQGAGAIALEKITDSVIDFVIDNTIKKIPLGGELVSLAKEIVSGIDKEKLRAQKANESYKIGQFVVDTRTKIGNLKSKIKTSKTNIIAQAVKSYGYLGKTEQANKKRAEELINFDLERAIASTHTVQGQFYTISESWVSSNFTKGWGGAEYRTGFLYMKVNDSWGVTHATIYAPRGEQLAEQLLKDGNGTFKTSAWNGPVQITDQSGFITARRDKPSEPAKVSAYGMLYSQKQYNTFVNNLKKYGVPTSTTVLSGKETTF